MTHLYLKKHRFDLKRVNELIYDIFLKHCENIWPKKFKQKLHISIQDGSSHTLCQICFQPPDLNFGELHCSARKHTDTTSLTLPMIFLHVYRKTSNLTVQMQRKKTLLKSSIGRSRPSHNVSQDLPGEGRL